MSRAIGHAEAGEKTILKHLDRIDRAVRVFGRTRRRWRLLGGLATWVLATLGGVSAWLALDWVLPLPNWLFLMLFVAVAAPSAWLLLARVVRPVCYRVEPAREALVVEALHGGLDNRVIGALQLGREMADAVAAGRGPDYSGALVESLVEQTAGLIESLNPCALLERRRARFRVVVAAVLLLAAGAGGVLARAAVAARAARLGDAWAGLLDTLFPVTLEVSPGDVAVVRGHAVDLQVRAAGARRREVTLARVVGDDDAETRTRLTLTDGAASFRVTEADEAFTYRFEYGRTRSGTYTVRVADLPGIQAVHFELTPPPYTGQPMRMLTGRIANLSALEGTAVVVSFAATTPLDAGHCHVEWGDGERQSIDVSGRFGTFAFVVRESERVSIHLTGAYGPGFEMPEPMRFDITVRTDQRPAVQWLTRLPGEELVVDEARRIQYRWFATDDFGVQRVRMRAEIDTIEALRVANRPRRTVDRETVIEPPRDRVRGSFDRVLDDLQPPLAPGDRVTVTLTVEDNNTVSGPGVVRSETLEFVVVSTDFKGWTEGDPGSILARERSALALAEFTRVQRATDLLQPVETLFRTAPPREAVKQELQVPAGRAIASGLAGDNIGRYLELLSRADEE